MLGTGVFQILGYFAQSQIKFTLETINVVGLILYQRMNILPRDEHYEKIQGFQKGLGEMRILVEYKPVNYCMPNKPCPFL